MEEIDLLQLELDECKRQLAATKSELERKYNFEQVLENANRAIAIIGFERDILWINKRAEQMVGYPLEEVKGKIVTDLLAGSETDRTNLIEAIKTARTGEVTSYENVIYSKDNRKIYVKTEVHPLYDLNKVIENICIYSTDITKEKEYLKTINENEKVYQHLLSTTSDIVYTLTIDGIITNVNKAWIKVTGYDKNETIGRSSLSFFHPNDVEKVIEARKNVLNGKMLSYSVEVRLISKTNDTVWFNAICTPLYSDDKKIIGFTGISRDITEQKRIQLYYQLLSKNIRDLVFLIESNKSSIKYVSPSVVEIAGYDPEELIEEDPFDFCHPDDLEIVRAYRKSQLNNTAKPTDTVTFRFPKKDGGYTWLEMTAKIIYDESTDTLWAITSAKVADLRKMEEEKIFKELEEEKRLNHIKSSFLQFVSHEFKTPLSIIKGLCELMTLGIEDLEETKSALLLKDISNIENETEEMISLIEEVLLLEESESGRMHFAPKNVDILALIKKVSNRVSLKQHVSEISNVTIIGTPKQICADGKLLEITFLNLISNAFKYSAGCPLPTISIQFLDVELVVAIKDFGIGIPQASIDKLFSTFYRAENVNQIDGTGLGLSIVKKLVELHKGKITCASKEGKGTEMVVTLPY